MRNLRNNVKFHGDMECISDADIHQDGRTAEKSLDERDLEQMENPPEAEKKDLSPENRTSEAASPGPGVTAERPAASATDDASRVKQAPSAASSEEADAAREEMIKQVMEQCTAATGEFIQGLDRNIKRISSDYCFPDFNLPPRYRFAPWQIPVKEVIDRTGTHGNLSKLWVEMLSRKKQIDDADKAVTEKFSEIRVYELKKGGISFLIISAFLTKWEDGRPVPLSADWLATLQKFKDRTVSFAEERYCDSISSVGVVVGSPADIPSWKENQGDANHFTVYCVKSLPCVTSETDSEWKFFFPIGTRGKVWNDFATHLLPVNSEQLADSLYRSLKKMWREESGRLTAGKLRTLWGMDDFLFRKTLRQLRKRNVFRVRGNELLQNDPEDVSEGTQLLNLSGMRDMMSSFFRQHAYHIINLIFMAAGLYICIGSEVNARYKVLTVTVLALTMLVSNTLVKMHERNPWRK